MGEKPMTPADLIEWHLRRADTADANGMQRDLAFHEQAAACIREMVERQLPSISKDGPNEIDRHGRFWLARQLLDSKLTAEEAYGIVAHHPAIQDALPPAPGAEA